MVLDILAELPPPSAFAYLEQLQRDSEAQEEVAQQLGTDFIVEADVGGVAPSLEDVWLAHRRELPCLQVASSAVAKCYEDSEALLRRSAIVADILGGFAYLAEDFAPKLEKSTSTAGAGSGGSLGGGSGSGSGSGTGIGSGSGCNGIVATSSRSVCHVISEADLPVVQLIHREQTMRSALLLSEDRKRTALISLRRSKCTRTHGSGSLCCGWVTDQRLGPLHTALATEVPREGWESVGPVINRFVGRHRDVHCVVLVQFLAAIAEYHASREESIRHANAATLRSGSTRKIPLAEWIGEVPLLQSNEPLWFALRRSALECGESSRTHPSPESVGDMLQHPVRLDFRADRLQRAVVAALQCHADAAERAPRSVQRVPASATPPAPLAELLARALNVQHHRYLWQQPMEAATSLDDLKATTLALLIDLEGEPVVPAELLLGRVMEMSAKYSTTGLAAAIWDFVAPVRSAPLHVAPWELPKDVLEIVFSYLGPAVCQRSASICYTWYCCMRRLWPPRCISALARARRPSRCGRHGARQRGPSRWEDDEDGPGPRQKIRAQQKDAAHRSRFATR
eukprot:NODE_701_length_1970_cov_33.771473_g648_i0.p1 GENE.NODE_701_length_1970_cov_33.771473_g648_i0~~NODE_701_length_1970_cov_33.771473_g648_i0.p1  ORF type:complete len:626 (+),score=96.86 NODE_701_length_1970_cov_33.771473_g648_i0:174-1880(+)